MEQLRGRQGVGDVTGELQLLDASWHRFMGRGFEVRMFVNGESLRQPGSRAFLGRFVVPGRKIERQGIPGHVGRVLIDDFGVKDRVKTLIGALGAALALPGTTTLDRGHLLCGDLVRIVVNEGVCHQRGVVGPARLDLTRLGHRATRGVSHPCGPVNEGASHDEEHAQDRHEDEQRQGNPLRQQVSQQTRGDVTKHAAGGADCLRTIRAGKAVGNVDDAK